MTQENSPQSIPSSSEYYGLTCILMVLYPVVIIGAFANSIILLLYGLNKFSSKWNKLKRNTNRKCFLHVSFHVSNEEDSPQQQNDPMADLFVLILAISDLLSCLFYVTIVINVESNNYEAYHEFTCYIINFFKALFPMFSCFMLAIIAFDRYMYICHPFVKALTFKRGTILISSLLILFVLPYSTMMTVFYTEPKETPNYTYFCDEPNSTSSSLFNTSFLRPINNGIFVILIFLVFLFYSIIYHTVVQSRKKSASLTMFEKDHNLHNSLNEQFTYRRLKKRLKTLVMLFLVEVFFILSYGISMIGMSLGCKFLPIIYLYLTMNMIDPIISLSLNERLRKDFIFLCLITCRNFDGLNKKKLSSTDRKKSSHSDILPISKRTGPKVVSGSVVNMVQQNDQVSV